MRGVDLLGLLGLVLVGVVVDDLAVVAQLRDLGLEQRLVEGLVAGGLGLGQQQGDGLAAAAAVAAVVAALGVVGAAGGEDAGAEDERGAYGAAGAGAGVWSRHGSPRVIGRRVPPTRPGGEASVAASHVLSSRVEHKMCRIS